MFLIHYPGKRKAVPGMNKADTRPGFKKRKQ